MTFKDVNNRILNPLLYTWGKVKRKTNRRKEHTFDVYYYDYYLIAKQFNSDVMLELGYKDKEDRDKDHGRISAMFDREEKS